MSSTRQIRVYTWSYLLRTWSYVFILGHTFPYLFIPGYTSLKPGHKGLTTGQKLMKLLKTILGHYFYTLVYGIFNNYAVHDLYNVF